MVAAAPQVLLLGCANAGKSTLMRNLRGETSSTKKQNEYIPTVGTELLDLKLGNKKSLTLREVGGAIKQAWQVYYHAAHAVIFLADSSSLPALAPAVVEFYSVATAPSLADKPLLLLLCKRDLEQAVPLDLAHQLFRLRELQNESVPPDLVVLEVSSVTGKGIPSVMNWLAQLTTTNKRTVK